MNNEIETVGDLIAALQRFDAALPVRCLNASLYYLHKPVPTCLVFDEPMADLDGNLEPGDEYVEL